MFLFSLLWRECSRVACHSTDPVLPTAQTNIITASPIRIYTHAQIRALIPEYPLSQIRPPNTAPTTHIAGVCSPGSDSQKNIIKGCFFLFFHFFFFFLRNSWERLVQEWQEYQFQTHKEMEGFFFFSGKIRQACKLTRTQIKTTSFQESPMDISF